MAAARLRQNIEDGEIAPTAWLEVVKEVPAGALVSGHWAFGQVAARYAMEVGIKKAREQGIAVVVLIQAHHIGRLGHYAEVAAAQQMISMIWSGSLGAEAPSTLPYGGRARLLHTNPIAMGFPAREEPPMMLDFATTALSEVKVKNAQRRGSFRQGALWTGMGILRPSRTISTTVVHIPHSVDTRVGP